MPILKRAFKSKKASTTPSISIEFPTSGEQIVRGHYAVKVAASFADSVEVSVNEGPWQACRSDSGFYWFDWWPEKTGKQTLVARASSSQGQSKKSTARNCTVVTPNSN